MKTIDKIYKELYEINKSKFISISYPVNSNENCKQILFDLGLEYKDATHICYGYVLSSPKVEKMSDDGEPSGTAGKPILELIKKKNLTDVMVVVVRYFGGIKLGAGGLVRAYTHSANLVLDKDNFIENKVKLVYKITVGYDEGDKIINDIKFYGGNIIECNYNEYIEIVFEGDFIDKLKLFYKIKNVEKLD